MTNSPIRARKSFALIPDEPLEYSLALDTRGVGGGRIIIAGSSFIIYFKCLIMYIGALSKLTGVSRKAIHHYESIGLIPVPQRKGRYRIYSETDADLILMIRRAQSLGFSLKEVKELALTRAAIPRCPTDMVLELVCAKRKELKSTISKVKLQDRQLADLQADLLKTRLPSRR